VEEMTVHRKYSVVICLKIIRIYTRDNGENKSELTHTYFPHYDTTNMKLTSSVLFVSSCSVK
jgi:hypothetical protein